jgi:LppP/LprE lipoprotein
MRRAAFVAPALCLAATLVPATASATTTSRAVAQAFAHRTYVNDPSLGRRHFKLEGGARFATASDGSTIAAFGMVLATSGDGSGQAVLLFRDGRFLGWASAFETLHLSVSSNGSAIKVRYGAYKGNDPFCCPSSFKTIRYRWTGGRIVASGVPPLIFGKRGSRLHLS